VLNRAFLEGAPSRLAELLPDAQRHFDTVRVIDLAELPDGRALKLNANTLKQKVVCYLEAAGR
jgi:hypothetical protein